GSNVDAAPVHKDMAVRDQLSGRAARISQAETIDDVIQSGFEKLEKCFTCHSALAQRILKDAPKLTLKQSILITEFLLFPERDCVIGLFPPGASRPVHAGWIIFSLQRFGGAKDRHAITAADSCFWSGVSAHGRKESDPALFRRGAAVVRHGRNIANQGKIEPDCLQSAHCRFASRS